MPNIITNEIGYYEYHAVNKNRECRGEYSKQILKQEQMRKDIN